MSRRILALLLIAPLLSGCGAGLKEEGRLPVSNPLGLSEGGTLELIIGSAPTSRNGGNVTKQASANYIGTFPNTVADVTIGNVRRFIFCQRIQSAQVQVPEGASLPHTITLNNFHLNATFSDSQAQATFDASVTGTVVLTHITGNDYKVTVQDAGQDPCLGATVESGNLNTLAQIVMQGGINTVEVTLTADVSSDPGLPDGTRILLTTGPGTGTLEL